MTQDWMGPYAPGDWGVVMHEPNTFPEWFSEPRWSQGTAENLAGKYTALERAATILRHKRGTRFHAVKGSTTNEIIIQFNRIMRA